MNDFTASIAVASAGQWLIFIAFLVLLVRLEKVIAILQEICVRTPAPKDDGSEDGPDGNIVTLGMTATPVVEVPSENELRIANFKALAVPIMLVALLLGGCALFTPKNAKTALDAVQLACVFESSVTDERALAEACDIANDLIPVLRNLVGQREAAKRSGVVWHRSSDAGADAAPEGGAR